MNRPLLTDPDPVHRVDRHSVDAQPHGAIVATDDEALIRDWAKGHAAEPATGEATASGPATVIVTDGDAGVRFNFPGAARFRAISWEEWFGNFHGHNLLFVYERDDPSGTYRLVPKGRLAGE
jgi:hypothetical protein